jgi:hypothetical protein
MIAYPSQRSISPPRLEPTALRYETHRTRGSNLGFPPTVTAKPQGKRASCVARLALDIQRQLRSEMGQGGGSCRVSTPWDACVLCVLAGA